jgi:beta-1,4-mannosyltransferase
MTQTFEEASGGIGSKSATARRTQIMMCPFINTTNRYIEIQKDLFRAIGYDVVPLSLKGLLQGGFIQLFKPNNILVFHWLELRPFKRKNGRTLLTIPGSLIFAFYCLLMCIGRAKVVYFQHDHAVHDTTGFIRRLSIRLIGFVRGLADFRVVHAPDFQARYDARYLPHPLYWDVPGQASTIPKKDTGAPLFSLLGAIRPYKQISAVLDVWPAECKLYIAGLGSDAYIATLNGILDKRSLRNTVRLDAKFLSDAEFAQGISNSDVLILPHAADSMLVSGAFFEAIGRVPLVISRSTPFMIWAAKKFDNVLLFNSIEELPEIIRSVNQSWPAIAGKSGNDLATDEFGWNACCRRYEQFFESVVGRGEVLEKAAAK